MLGLGSGLSTGSVRPIQLLGTYTSDFSSDADGWIAHSAVGTLTVTGANNRPGGSGDANWLKGAFDTTQENFVGLVKNNLSPGWNRSVDDYFTVSCKMWLHNESGEDWGGADSVTTIFSVGYWTGSAVSPSGNTGQNITQDQEFTVSTITGATIGHAGYQAILIYWTAPGDLPQEDAEVYIKDLVINFYGTG